MDYKQKAFELVSESKYLYKNQIESGIPEYMQHYYPNVPLEKLTEAVKYAYEYLTSLNRCSYCGEIENELEFETYQKDGKTLFNCGCVGY